MKHSATSGRPAWNWLRIALLAMALASPMAAQATAAQFASRCGGCHSVTDPGRANASYNGAFIRNAINGNYGSQMGSAPSLAGVTDPELDSIATYIGNTDNVTPLVASTAYNTNKTVSLAGTLLMGTANSQLNTITISGLSATEGTASTSTTSGAESITYNPDTCFVGVATFSFFARSTITGQQTSTRDIQVTVGAPASGLAVGGAASASGQTGVPFSYSTSATCPSLVTGYTIVGTPLPAGLALNGAGQITGTPTAVSPATAYTIRTTYTGGAFTDKSVTITITLGPPSITSGAPVGGLEGTAYAGHTVVATNGPNTFTVTSGALPPGLTLNASTGAISGTPSVTADPPNSAASITYPVQFTATNSTGSTVQNTSFTIGARPVVNSAATAGGQTGVAFNYQITATKSPTTFSASGLPPGLAINTGTGLISGTPTTVGGPTSVTITASNAFATSASFNLDITITLGPPAITSSFTMPPGGEGNAYTGYAITATNTPHTSYGATGLPPGLVVDTATGVISGTPSPGAAAGSPYSVTVSATNVAGTGTRVVSLVISQIAPVVSGPASVTGQTGVPFTYQIVAANGPTSYNVTGLPPGLSVNTTTGLISGTPTATGLFSGNMSATNGSGSNSKAITFTITLGPPGITSAATASGAAGFPFTYQITASNSPASFGASGLPSGLSVNPATGAISGVPAANGVFNATVTATNATGTGSLAVTITIAFGLPAINSAATATGATGAPFSYQVTATNGPTSFGASGLPPGLAIDAATGIISGTPTDFGSYPVTLTASNGTGMGSRGLTITITQSGVAVTSPARATGSIGTAFRYAVLVANGPATVTVAGLPPGLTFDSATQVIGGTPSAGGNFAVTITAFNTVGQATFTLNIDIAFAPATVQDAAVAVEYETAKAITLPISGQFTSVTIVSLPEHGLVSVQGGVATYTPATGYSGPDAFTFTASSPAGTTAVATVRITVGALAPSANAAVMTVPLNTPGTVDMAKFVRGSGLTGVSATQPAHGSVTVNGMQVTYTPRTDFFGTDSFTYIAFGSAGKTTPAVVTVTVTGRPNPAETRDVGGLVDAQVQAARRFSDAQIGNFQRRMETMHRAREIEPQVVPEPAPAAAAPSPAPAAAAEKPVRVATTGLMPVSLFTPLMNAATTRSLDVAASTGGAPADANGFISSTNVWAAGTGHFGRRDASGEASGLRFSTDGLSVGVDRRFSPRLALGLGVGYARDESEVGESGSRSKARGHSFALYGSFQPSPVAFIDMLVGVGKIDFDSRRYVAAVDEFASGSRRGDQAFASLAAGAEFRRDGALISPYGRIDLTSDRLKAYSENGAGLYALTYNEQRIRSSQLAMGVRAESQHDADFGRVIPRLRVEYRRQLDDPKAASVRYADLFAGDEYSLGPAGTSRNALLLGVGSDFQLRNGVKLGLDYQAQRASGGGNVQSVRMIASWDLDGRGLPAWNWQPRMFKDPIGIEFGYAFDDNVTRGRLEGEKLVDRAFSLSVGEPIPFKLGEHVRLVMTPSLIGEKFQRYAGLGRFSAGAQAEVQYRASGAFDAATYSLVGRAAYDQFESSHRTGPRYFAGVNVRRSLTDKIDVFGEVGASARNGRSEVFRTRDWSAKANLDYSLGRRGVLYLTGEYRRGDTVSSGAASLANVGIADVFVPDDAFEAHEFFAYRFDARTVLGTLGWNYPLGPRDSLDLSWRRVQATPQKRPGFDWNGPASYIDNQYSIVYLMRF